MSPTTRNDAVGNHFEGLKGAIFSTDIDRVDDVIFIDRYLHAVFVFLVGLEFSDDLGVGDLFAVVSREIYVTYDVGGVGAFDML